MAIKGVFDKIKSGTDVSAAVSTVTKLVPHTTANQSSLSDLRKQQKSLVEEKSKLYSYLGMEIYDLHTAGGELPIQANNYCEKLDEISKTINELNSEIEKKQARAKQNNTCECGAVLSKADKFCPSCGKPTENAPVICSGCGAAVDRGIKFCPSCGFHIQNGNQANQQNKPTVQCVCGAMVESGQPMCMECGRRVKTQ